MYTFIHLFNIISDELNLIFLYNLFQIRFSQYIHFLAYRANFNDKY